MSSTHVLDSSSTTDHPHYDEYEDSGVDWLGEIPAHWKLARLRFFLEITPSKSEVRKLPEDMEVSFVPMESVKEEGGLDLSNTKQLEEVVDGYTYFRNGDVLVAKITPCFENGKGALARNLTNGVGFGTTEVHVLRPGEELDERYLFYATMSHPFRKVGESTMYGAGGQKRVSDDFIRNLQWPIPPLDEQRAIAAYLDRETERIDTLIEKKERLIELLEEKRTALISRVVTKGLDSDVEMQDSGVEWLGEIPAGWEVARLKFLAEVQSGIAKGKRYDEDVETVELPYLRVANVQDGFLNLDEVAEIEVAVDDVGRYLLQPGDVLMTEGGDYDKLGRGTVWTGDIDPCLHQNHIFAVRPRSIESEWIALITQAHYAKHFFIVQSVQSTNLASISMSSLQDLPVVVPTRSTRQAILDYVDRETERIDTLTHKVESAIDWLKEYRTALISAAVTGQIDVREERMDTHS